MRWPLAHVIPSLLAFLASFASFSPGAARAEDGEWALSVGPEFRGLSESVPDDGKVFRAAPGALLRVRYGVGDFFQLGASLSGGVALATDASALAPVVALYGEAHYIIDVVTWVPFVTLGAGALLRGEVPGAGLRTDFALALGGGLEYRPERDFSVGFTGRYELVVTDFARSDVFSLALVYTLFFE